ncbi:MAG: NAD(P)H-dependent oxidoreductase [Burkholderiaceae bacterium]|nr:NAD(P)H-dependent oxidoreductase [Burkholderiaceae bacterium]
MNILHIDSSILGDASASRGLTRDLVDTLVRTNPGADVTYRDLGASVAGHLDGELLAARSTPPGLRSAEARIRAEEADAVTREFLDADLIVLGAPMYNFGIPSQLKTWIDLVAVAGVTFRYTEAGPQGLAGDKRVIIAATAGGQHAGLPSGGAHIDYLKFLLGFLGVTDIDVITAEGLAIGAAEREAALATARDALEAVTM